MNYLSTSIDLPNLDECTIAVLGLGYVGLPLAACFATTAKSVLNSNLLRRSVIGYDVNDRRVSELLQGDDRTLELTQSEIRHAQNCGLTFTNNSEDLVRTDVFIVTVPTPIDDSKRLTLLHPARTCWLARQLSHACLVINYRPIANMNQRFF